MIKRTIPHDLWEKIKPLAEEMRHVPTPAEKALWQYLRDRRLEGVKFRRQHGAYRFIIDFASLEADLAVEIDGPIHDRTPEYDALRSEVLEALGYKVIRFNNDEVLEAIESVLARIKANLNWSVSTPRQ